MSDARDCTRADLSVMDRFWPKVDKLDNGCWVWTAATNGKGYGIFRGGQGRDANGSRKWILAHRFAFELLRGAITSPELDHRCRNRPCVNPDHLEPVTHRENTLRGESPVAMQARRSECIKGHPFDKKEKNGKRRCSVCDKAKELRRYFRRYGRVPKQRLAA